MIGIYNISNTRLKQVLLCSNCRQKFCFLNLQCYIGNYLPGRIEKAFGVVTLGFARQFSVHGRLTDTFLVRSLSFLIATRLESQNTIDNARDKTREFGTPDSDSINFSFP